MLIETLVVRYENWSILLLTNQMAENVPSTERNEKLLQRLRENFNCVPSFVFARKATNGNYVTKIKIQMQIYSWDWH